MNKVLASALFGLGLLASGSVMAHGCSGNVACSSGPVDQSTTKNQQQQQQAAASRSESTSNPISNAYTTNNSRHLSVQPVRVQIPPMITPSAQVSRYASHECGPQMVIVHRDIKGINNRMTRAEAIDAGVDQYVIPDLEEPYRRVQITDDIYQLIGHRLIETTAVPNISTAGGFGIGGNGSSGAGASFGMQTGGQLQSLQTTIRLVPCVAYQVDMRPLKIRN